MFPIFPIIQLCSYTLQYLIVGLIKLFISTQGNILSVVQHSVQLTGTDKSVLTTTLIIMCDKPSSKLLSEIEGNTLAVGFITSLYNFPCNSVKIEPIWPPLKIFLNVLLFLLMTRCHYGWHEARSDQGECGQYTRHGSGKVSPQFCSVLLITI